MASAATGILGGFFVSGANVPFFNVTITTLGMAGFGSLLAFAYGTPVKGHQRLFGYAAGGIFIGVWSIHLLRWRGVPVPEEVAGPIAGCVALISRWAIPAIVESIPAIWGTIINRFFGGTTRKGSEE